LKKLFFISLLFIGFSSQAQRTYVYGVVKDSITLEDMIGVHIRNIDAGSLTSTNAEGKFKMPSQIGDTLVFSSVGHKTLAWIVDSSWFQEEEIEFLLPVNTIYLDEVVVGEFPEYERFKDMIMQEQPEDTTFEIFGVPRVVMDQYPVAEKVNFFTRQTYFFIRYPPSTIRLAKRRRKKEKCSI